MQQHEVGPAAGGQAVVLQPQQPRGLGGDGLKALAHGGRAGHVRHVQAHVGHFQQVGAAAAVPGVEHAVLAQRHRQPGGQQLGHARHATAAWVAVVAPLQRDVDKRVGHHAQLGLGHQGHEAAGVGVVHAVQRGQVRAGDAPVQAQALGFKGQRFYVA